MEKKTTLLNLIQTRYHQKYIVGVDMVLQDPLSTMLRDAAPRIDFNKDSYPVNNDDCCSLQGLIREFGIVIQFSRDKIRASTQHIHIFLSNNEAFENALMEPPGQELQIYFVEKLQRVPKISVKFISFKGIRHYLYSTGKGILH